jgi:uncharacterized damage-inducible protein DinB
MPIIDSILAELDTESKSTRRVLERIPESKFGWKPHEKSMTLGYLAMHVATIPGFFGKLATQDGFDAANFTPMAVPATTAELVAAFDSSMADARKFLSSLEDAKLMAPWTFSHGGKTLMTLPRIGLIRGILCSHLYHHRGQLSVYLRLLDIPVPSIYGPSADENPFA